MINTLELGYLHQRKKYLLCFFPPSPLFLPVREGSILSRSILLSLQHPGVPVPQDEEPSEKPGFATPA